MTHTPDNPTTPEKPEPRPECLDLLADDRPTPQEVDSMWNAIAAELPAGAVETKDAGSFWTRKYVREAVYSLTTAACLAMLFFFGQFHYHNVLNGGSRVNLAFTAPECATDASCDKQVWKRGSTTSAGIGVSYISDLDGESASDLCFGVPFNPAEGTDGSYGYGTFKGQEATDTRRCVLNSKLGDTVVGHGDAGPPMIVDGTAALSSEIPDSGLAMLQDFVGRTRGAYHYAGLDDVNDGMERFEQKKSGDDSLYEVIAKDVSPAKLANIEDVRYTKRATKTLPATSATGNGIGSPESAGQGGMGGGMGGGGGYMMGGGAKFGIKEKLDGDFGEWIDRPEIADFNYAGDGDRDGDIETREYNDFADTFVLTVGPDNYPSRDGDDYFDATVDLTTPATSADEVVSHKEAASTTNEKEGDGAEENTRNDPVRVAEALTPTLDNSTPPKDQERKAEAKRDPSSEPARKQQRRVITTAVLTLEVDQYTSAEERVLGTLEQHGAYVQSSELAEKKEGEAIKGRLTIRVAPERFDALFGALKAFGRVVQENVSANDVSGKWVDLEARIRSGMLEEKQLLALLERENYFDDIESLLLVEKELARVRETIEQQMSQLRDLGNKVSLCTIHLYLQEPSRIHPSAEIAVAVRELGEAEKSLHELLGSADARLLKGRTYDASGGPLHGRYGITVPRKTFAEVLNGLDKLGRITKREVSGFQHGDEDAEWASLMECPIDLVLQEYAYQIPGGTIKLEVSDLTKALDEVQPILAEYGASIAESSTTRRDDDSRIGELKVNVVAGKFRKMTKAVEPLGRPLAIALSGETGEIHGGSADVLSTLNLTLAEQERQIPTGQLALRVKDFEKARERLSGIVASAEVQVQASSSRQENNGRIVGVFKLAIRSESMEETVASIEGIGIVASREIDGLGLGKLSKVNPNAWGVINILLVQDPPTSPTQEQSTGKIQTAMRDGLKGLYSSLGMILYGVVVLLPWVILLGGVMFVGKRVLRKRGSEKGEEKNEETQETGNEKSEK